VAERSYDRSALILDGDEHSLTQVSMSLLVLGHRSIYADDLDELLVLARERESRVGALLVPAHHAFEWWPLLSKRILEPLALSPRSVLPVGDRLPDADSETLYCDGVRWALREPYSPWELRFAVSQVLSESDANDGREDARVPCSIAVEVASESRSQTARITDLSRGGVFIQLAHPHSRDTEVVLCVELCGRVVSLRGRVAWRTGPSSPAWLDRGMGVDFQDVDAETLELLRQQKDRALDRFRLVAAIR
jgi:uncharacterized protein (TIGR02266 family)